MLVSVIVPTYNAENYIEKLLDSLLVQDFHTEKLEIIVFDDASKDFTCDIVGRFAQVKLYTNDINMGFAVTCSRAFEKAKGEFIVFLNQDTVCDKLWLTNLLKPMKEDEKIAISGSNVVPAESGKKLEFPDRLYYTDLSILGYGLEKTANEDFVYPKIISGCSFAIRKKVIDELGYLFDETFGMYCEDTDLSFRVLNAGYKLIAVKDSVVYHLHDYSKPVNLKTAAQAIRNRVIAFYKNMTLIEFLLFYPLIILAGPLKIFTFSSLSLHKKSIYFIPFTILSIVNMLFSLVYIPGYYSKRKHILNNRIIGPLSLLKVILLDKK